MSFFFGMGIFSTKVHVYATQNVRLQRQTYILSFENWISWFQEGRDGFVDEARLKRLHGSFEWVIRILKEKI